MITTSMPEISRFDIVRLGNGHQMVVTQINHNRPVNPFNGVLINGKGAEYKFGPKHRPVVIGKADANHPALLARRGRIEAKVGSPLSQDAVAFIFNLLEAVEAGDLPKAKILTAAIRTTDQFKRN